MGRTLTTLLSNRQHLDGGAMFGHVPRALWARWVTPDASHRVALACRCLLITEADGRRILCETGIGACFPPELRARYGVDEPDHRLLASLAAIGLSDADIDVVVLSHLHFDHAGGLLAPWDGAAPPRLLFPHATYVVGADAFDRATAPHARDRASFLPDLPALLEASGRLHRVDDDVAGVLGPGFAVHRSDGHTPGMLLLEVPMPAGPVVFAADLIPGVPWVHPPVTMGYDRFPERVTDEKTALLSDLAARGGRLCFTHDPDIALARIVEDPAGRFTVRDPLPAAHGLAA